MTLPEFQVSRAIRLLSHSSETTSVSACHTILSSLSHDDIALSGRTATVKLSGENLELDWRDVFNVNRDVTFSVYAGTSRGFGDVINHVVTEETQYKGLYTPPLSDVFILIQAVYYDGPSEMYRDQLEI